MPLRGPAEATEAMRGPAGVAGDGAGANGFGDFCRSCAGCAGATAPVIHRRVSDSLLEGVLRPTSRARPPGASPLYIVCARHH